MPKVTYIEFNGTEHALPALKPSFMPLDRSGDAFSWDPL